MLQAQPCCSATSFRAALFGPSAAAKSIDLGAGCWVLHGRLRRDAAPSAEEVEELWAAQPKEREHFEMYGRPVAVPRHVRLYSSDPLTVRVSGTDFDATRIGKAKGQPRFLERLLACVPACDYNAVVANWYPTGADYIGWHGDKEAQIDGAAPIVSLSLGADRRFQVRDEASRKTVFDTTLRDGDCVVMGGPGFQQRFKHRVPKMTAQRDGSVGPRLNLTVRKYKAAKPKAKRAAEADREPAARKLAKVSLKCRGMS